MKNNLNEYYKNKQPLTKIDGTPINVDINNTVGVSQ